MARVSRNPSALLISTAILASWPGHAAAAQGDAGGNARPALAIADTPASAGRRSGPPASVELMLLVTVNARERGIVPVRQADGDFWVDRAMFAQLGIAAPAGGSGPVSLQSLTGAIVQYKEAEQALQLVVPPTMLEGPTSRINEATIEPPMAEAATGLVLNYDMAINAYRSNVDIGLLSAVRAFSPAGVIETTQVSRERFGEREGFDTIRLDTSFTRAFPGRRLSLQVGDIITSGTAWSRQTRLGGLRFGTDFSLQPYFVTAPQRRLEGTATLPSRIEMFVNGVRRYSGKVEPGRYEVGLGPGRIDGAGRARLVVTDMLGRVTVQDFALYDSSRLLRRGLDDWSFEIGAARQDYGLRSFAYDLDPAASLTWRSGLRDWLTLEAHAEGKADFGNAGIGGALALGQAGVVTASAAHSESGRASGQRVTLGYSWQGYGFHLSGEMRRSFGTYIDLGSDRFNPTPPDSTFIQAGYSDPVLGAFGLSYTSLRLQRDAHYRSAEFNWNRQIGRNASLRLSYNHDLEDRRRSALRLSLQFTPSRGTYGNAGYEFREGGRAYDASLQHSTPLAGGIGWRADVRQTAAGVLGMAQLDLLTDAGGASAALRTVHGRIEGYGSYSGALVLMDGGVFAARRIDNAFAVVSTDRIGDVPVTLGNEFVGRTNRHGQLLVTRLNPWQNNLVGIDARDLPSSVMVDRVSALAVPSDRAGTRIRFAVREFRALVLKAVTADGTPLPPGTLVSIAGTSSEPTALGLDGLLYLEDPPLGVRLLVHAPQGDCEIAPRFALAKSGITQLGEQICQTMQASDEGEPAKAPLPKIEYLALPDPEPIVTIPDAREDPPRIPYQLADGASPDITLAMSGLR